MIIKATYDPPSIHTASLPRLSVDGRLCRRDHGGGVGVDGGGGTQIGLGALQSKTSLPCSTSYTLLESPDCQAPLLLLFICLFLGRPSHAGF